MPKASGPINCLDSDCFSVWRGGTFTIKINDSTSFNYRPANPKPNNSCRADNRLLPATLPSGIFGPFTKDANAQSYSPPLTADNVSGYVKIGAADCVIPCTTAEMEIYDDNNGTNYYQSFALYLRSVSNQCWEQNGQVSTNVTLGVCFTSAFTAGSTGDVPTLAYTSPGGAPTLDQWLSEPTTTYPYPSINWFSPPKDLASCSTIADIPPTGNWNNPCSWADVCADCYGDVTVEYI